MKVLLAAEIFPPDIGGPATYTVKLANALIKHGNQVEVVCYSTENQQDDFQFKVHRIIRSKFKLPHYYKYEKTLEKLASNFDVIYAMGPVGSGKSAMKVAKKLNKKLIVKVVGDYAWEQAQGAGKTNLLLDDFQKEKFSGKIGMLQKIERTVCQNANRVIVPSQYLKKIVSGWGVSEENIEVVYNSKDIDHKIENQSSQNTIISVGRLVSWKGFDTLIKIIAELDKDGVDLNLNIFGKGPDLERLNKLIADLKLEKKVSINHIAQNEVALKLANAQMFVLNTGYEGLSHAILEAMATGTPVIASNLGGNPELITDDENGILFEYNNKEQIKEAILKLHNDPELRQKFADNSKHKLQNFTFEKMINDTIKVLRNNN